MRGVEARKNLRACFEIVAAEVTRRKMTRSSQKTRLVTSAATSAGLISKHALSVVRAGPSSLDPRRAAFREGANLLQRGHGCIPGESRQQCAMRPAESNGFFLRFAGEQSVKKAGGSEEEAVRLGWA